MHKRQKSIIHKKGNLEFYRRLSHYSTLVNIFHHDGFPKRRKQQLDSFYSPRKNWASFASFHEKRGKKRLRHHLNSSFPNSFFSSDVCWLGSDELRRKKKKAKSRGKEICGQVRYNLPIRTNSMLNCIQHPRHICLSYMPLPLLLHRRVKNCCFFFYHLISRLFWLVFKRTRA